MQVPTLDLGTIIVWLIIGALAGTAAGTVLSGGKGGYGFIRNTLIGLVGAVIGGFLFDVFRVSIGVLQAIQINAQQLLAAFLGAVLFVILLRGIGRNRG